MAAESQGCPHLVELDGEEEKETMLKRYKTVISWHMVRRHEAAHPAKRRKVGDWPAFAFTTECCVAE